MILSATLLLLSALASPEPTAQGAVPEMSLGFDVYAELADLDRDGRVTSAELEAFFAHCAKIAPCVLLNEFHAEILFQGLNHDGLTDWTLLDLQQSLAEMDVDGDGVIDLDEPGPAVLTRGEGGTRGWIHRLAYSLVLEEGDRDASGVLDPKERQVLLDEWRENPDPLRTVQRWIAASKTREPADRNFMSPGVSFLTLEAELDQDRDGCVDTDRVDAWFAAVDRDGDAVLVPAERQRRGGRAESWSRVTDERRELPPLMPWQRSLSDALAIQRRTGQPLLICVNMDGETACDSLAYWRYRDPEFARLAAGFVCVVASPDDHRPRDYDDRGRRLESQRLGRVTDAEHVEIEPVLYERYFDGRRVAPRHVGVAADGSILFDIFLTNDASRLDEALALHGRPVAPERMETLSDGDLAIRTEADAREAFERRMRNGSPEKRRELLAYVPLQPDAGLIAMASGDAELRALAAVRLAGARTGLRAAHGLELLRSLPLVAANERAAVVARLDALGEVEPAVARGLAAWRAAQRPSRLGDVRDWMVSASLADGGTLQVSSRGAALDRLDELDRGFGGVVDRPFRRLARARALYNLARALAASQEDPRDACAECVQLARTVSGLDDAAVQGMIACCAALSGDWYEGIEAARRSLSGQMFAQSDPQTVETLRALLTACSQSIGAELRAGRAALVEAGGVAAAPPGVPGPGTTARVADALLTGRTLLAHPAGRLQDGLVLIRLLTQLDDVASLPRVLDEALARFPYAAELHQELRGQVLRDVGASGMGPRYAGVRAAARDAAAEPTLIWFEGLGFFTAAEWLGQVDDSAGAGSSYGESLAAFGAAIEAQPAYADSANHYRVLAHAALATLRLGEGDLASAFEHAKAALSLRPASLSQVDGLGQTPLQRVQAVAEGLGGDEAAVLSALVGEAKG